MVWQRHLGSRACKEDAMFAGWETQEAMQTRYNERLRTIDRQASQAEVRRSLARTDADASPDEPEPPTLGRRMLATLAGMLTPGKRTELPGT